MENIMKKYLFQVVCLLAFFAFLFVGVSGKNISALAAMEQETDTKEKEKEETKAKEKDEKDAYTEELEQQKQDAIDKIDSIKSDIDTVEDKIKDLKNSKSNLQSYINQLDGQVNQLSAQIADLEDKISQKEVEIAETEEELAQAQQRSEEQYQMMKKRIRYMYEQSGQSLLVLFFESESLADFINRAEYTMQMSAYDRQMMDVMIEMQKEIEEQKLFLEEEKAEQEALLSQVEQQHLAVNKAIDAKSQEMAVYQSQIQTASGEQSDYEKQLAEQEKLLEQIENQIAAAAAADSSAGDGDGGASGFLWPCPSSRRITSYFGPRTAPVAGASTYHKGIDIGASTGSAIVASAGGRVTTSAYSSSAGNYIVISHGNGIASVYMHASARYVSVGDVVTKGQTIAAVGSTGYSTGPHLHFGIVVNGSYVDPLNYVR